MLSSPPSTATVMPISSSSESDGTPKIPLDTPLVDALMKLTDKPREKIALWAQVLTNDDIDTVRDVCALPDPIFERLMLLPNVSLLLQGLLMRLRMQHSKAPPPPPTILPLYARVDNASTKR